MKGQFWGHADDAAFRQNFLIGVSGCRTSLGRVRAWLRLAMMQKTLAGYFSQLIELRDKLLVYVSCRQSNRFSVYEIDMCINMSTSLCSAPFISC